MSTTTVQRLFDAAASGDLKVVEKILDQGVPVNVRNGAGQTPLLVAVRCGRHDVVRHLIDRGARLGVRAEPLLGLLEPIQATDVHEVFEWASAATHTNDVPVYVHHEGVIDPDTAAERAFEVLDSTDDLLCEAGPLLTAAVCGHVDIVDALLRAGTDPNATDWEETPPIVGAAMQGHAAAVARLITAGADIDAGTGFTALEEGVVHGHLAVVELLLAAGANVNRRNADGGTPLMMAATAGRLSIVRHLVQHGADVNAESDGDSALSCAAACGHVDVYAYLLPRSMPSVQARGDIALGAYLAYVGRL